MNHYRQTAADLDEIHRPRAHRNELLLDIGLVCALSMAIISLIASWGAQ